jgi:hypothetical protein
MTDTESTAPADQPEPAPLGQGAPQGMIDVRAGENGLVKLVVTDKDGKENVLGMSYIAARRIGLQMMIAAQNVEDEAMNSMMAKMQAKAAEIGGLAALAAAPAASQSAQ